MKKESERATRPSQRPRRAEWNRPRLSTIRTADTETGARGAADGHTVS
jgi:hypothetical protein